MRLDDIPLRYRGAVMEKMSDAGRRDRPTGERIIEPPRLERLLQRDAEKWLEFTGYWRRTAKNIASGPPPRGWQIHIQNAPRNPLVLDLIILDNSGEWIEVELKGTATRVARHQRQLIDQHSRRFECRSIDELRMILSEFGEN